MSLSLQHRQVGEVAVITCQGRLIAGDESSAFREYLDEVLPMHPRLVLNLEGIDYVDSAGLGLLVRYFIRAQNVQGGLTVAEVSPRVAEVLRITRLRSALQPYDSEADAIAAAHQPAAPHDTTFVGPQVLCVDASPDVLAYLRELLKEAGYGALTASNLADAKILLRAIRPSLVVLGDGIGPAAGAQEFRTAAPSVVELPRDFGRLDPAAAAEQVLAAVRARMPGA